MHLCVCVRTHALRRNKNWKGHMLTDICAGKNLLYVFRSSLNIYVLLCELEQFPFYLV